eukprot:TRINITY_DN111940_c0_g1_i2.p1 TRINITY_DN111940_c0_g1~~TRINITY_DN111940_c0_g1_i2.p1  ORF type:complete len:690 (-),score=69.78 TRINITY_DN111940_c0_g1_i2:46-2115(-)
MAPRPPIPRNRREAQRLHQDEGATSFGRGVLGLPRNSLHDKLRAKRLLRDPKSVPAVVFIDSGPCPPRSTTPGWATRHAGRHQANEEQLTVSGIANQGRRPYLTEAQQNFEAVFAADRILSAAEDDEVRSISSATAIYQRHTSPGFPDDNDHSFTKSYWDRQVTTGSEIPADQWSFCATWQDPALTDLDSFAHEAPRSISNLFDQRNNTLPEEPPIEQAELESEGEARSPSPPSLGARSPRSASLCSTIRTVRGRSRPSSGAAYASRAVVSLKVHQFIEPVPRAPSPEAHQPVTEEFLYEYPRNRPVEETDESLKRSSPASPADTGSRQTSRPTTPSAYVTPRTSVRPWTPALGGRPERPPALPSWPCRPRTPSALPRPKGQGQEVHYVVPTETYVREDRKFQRGQQAKAHHIRFAAFRGRSLHSPALQSVADGSFNFPGLSCPKEGKPPKMSSVRPGRRISVSSAGRRRRDSDDARSNSKTASATTNTFDPSVSTETRESSIDLDISGQHLSTPKQAFGQRRRSSTLRPLRRLADGTFEAIRTGNSPVGSVYENSSIGEHSFTDEQKVLSILPEEDLQRAQSHSLSSRVVSEGLLAAATATALANLDGGSAQASPKESIPEDFGVVLLEDVEGLSSLLTQSFHEGFAGGSRRLNSNISLPPPSEGSEGLESEYEDGESEIDDDEQSQY